ncbi:MAG: serine/threonine-protein kinase [Deltaproteobacteria bacterium]|nr:serine/threonine-protein kinase [Deltaproteobacteria bacterium]
MLREGVGEGLDRAATASWNGGDSAIDPTTGPAASAGPDATARYELLEELGRGGMAIVRAAFDRTLNRRVAIKLLHPDQIHATGRARLAREAQALAQLRHRNVVAIYDVGAIGGHDFLAMELIEGAPLRAWMKGRGWRELVRMFVAAGRGLAAAHAVGLIHRDFKPDNVLVDADGTPRVGDFGLARLASAGPEPDASPPGGPEALTRSVTRTDVIVGTLGYLAPEVIAGAPADARTDQFAFAVALTEALTGARPFAGDTPAALAAAIARGPRLPRVASAPVRRALVRALAIEPADRFPSMDALLVALERALGRRRRAVLAGAGLGAVGAAAAVAVAMGLAGGPVRPTCELDPHQLDAVWGPAQRDALGRGFAAASRAYGPTVATEVIATLDRYAADLVLAGGAACTAAASPAQTAEVTNLRAACLQRRRDQLGLMVDALARSTDAAGVARAPLVVAELAPVADCADVTALLRPVGVPADPALAARVATVQREVDRILFETRRENAKAVIADAQALVPVAVALHHPPTEAEALHALAAAEGGLDRAADSATHDAAALAAAQAGHHEALVVRAAETLALNLGRRQGRVAEGMRWAQLAVATADGAGKPPAMEYRAHYAVMVIARVGGQLDLAEREGALALEYATAARVSEATLAEVVNSLGGVALERQDYAGAAVQYQRARELGARHFGEDHPLVAMIDRNLGSVALALGDNGKALALRRHQAEVLVRTLGADAARTGEGWLTFAETQALVGDASDRLANARRGAAIVAAAPNLAPIRRLDAQARLALLLVTTGEIAEGRALARTTITATDALGADAAGPRFTSTIALAEAALRDRPVREATAAVDAAAAALATVNNDRLASAAVRRLQARALRLGGHLDDALAAATEARAMLAHTDGKATVTMGAAALDEGLARLARGDRAGAIEPLTTASALLIDPLEPRDHAAAVAALTRAQGR